MATYDFSSLSPTDFETLSGDLLEAELEVRLERFAAGRDKGIDLRYAPSVGETGLIVQAKHYLRSGYPKLLSVLKKDELPKIDRLAPDRYVLTTSVSLTPAKKQEIVDGLHPHLKSTGDVLGREDLNALLTKHERVERNHFKLWMTNVGVLESVLHRAVTERSREFLSSLPDDVCRFVRTHAFSATLDIVEEHHVCIVSGSPGIGKSILARAVLADLATREFDVVVVSGDIKEAEDMWQSGKAQAFYYDDFLGVSVLEESLAKNEDDRLVDFIQRVGRTENKRIVLTTREYILRRAQSRFEKLERADIQKLVVTMADYPTAIRAEILYNHLHFAELPDNFLREFIETRAYWSVIRHENYNPRLIEQVVRLARRNGVAGDGFAAFFEQTLSDPSMLWTAAFENQLTAAARSMLLALFALDGSGATKVLSDTTRALSEAQGNPLSGVEFSQALRDLDGTFIRTRLISPSFVAGGVVVSFANPSVRDFLTAYLAANPYQARSLIEAVSSFAQLANLARYRAATSEEGSSSIEQESAIALGKVFAESETLLFSRMVSMLGIDGILPGTEDWQSRLDSAARRVSRLLDEFSELSATRDLALSAADTLVGPWTQMNRLLTSTMDLLRQLARLIPASDSFAEISAHMKGLATSRLEEGQEWEDARTILYIDGVGEPAERDKLDKDFADFVEDKLAVVFEPEDPDEFAALAGLAADLEQAAQHFGLVHYGIDELQDEVARHAEQFGEREPDYERDSERGGPTGDGTAEIDSMFQTLR